ncbi:MAG TPA: hypothetical protein VMB66_09340 [Candidatus Acidoferrales bacterium]|nr:hypothetical protein [Candidatus Acidoferrales bacterium]
MKNTANRIARSNQATLGAEGYVFDGNDGSQMAFWTCAEDAVSPEHTHEYDEYMVVVQGCYTLVINGHRIPINAEEEYLIPEASPMLAMCWPERERFSPSEASAPAANCNSMNFNLRFS